MMQTHYWFQTLISQKGSKGRMASVKELIDVDLYGGHLLWI